MGASADRVRELLETVLDALDLEADLEVSEDEETIKATMHGEDLGILIGRHGQTIDALQHLSYRASLDAGSKKRVTVDAAGYRERRGSLLRREADEAAESARRLGRPVRLDPMGAIERRLVHEHLRDQDGIETWSEGEEPERRLVVGPLED
jgi:spoIIIJ-associated protein